MSDATADLICQFIEGIPCNALLGLVVRGEPDGSAAVELPFRPEITNHVGTTHAAALFGVADATSGAAIFLGLGDLAASVTPIARGGEITYRRPGTTAVTGRAVVDAAQLATIREELAADGVTRPDVVVHLTDDAGTELATATFHWHLKANASS